MRKCSVDGCDKKHLANGLCSMHYNRKMRGTFSKKRICSGCGKPFVGNMRNKKFCKDCFKKRCKCCGKIFEAKQMKIKYCSKSCASKINRTLPQFSKRKNGKYITIKVGNKFVREHRYIMEKHLGRKLNENEYVHHKNGVKNDNRLDNLEVVLNNTHMGNVRCPHCLKKFKIK